MYICIYIYIYVNLKPASSHLIDIWSIRVQLGHNHLGCMSTLAPVDTVPSYPNWFMASAKAALICLLHSLLLTHSTWAANPHLQLDQFCRRSRTRSNPSSSTLWDFLRIWQAVLKCGFALEQHSDCMPWACTLLQRTLNLTWLCDHPAVRNQNILHLWDIFVVICIDKSFSAPSTMRWIHLEFYRFSLTAIEIQPLSNSVHLFWCNAPNWSLWTPSTCWMVLHYLCHRHLLRGESMWRLRSHKWRPRC